MKKKIFAKASLIVALTMGTSIVSAPLTASMAFADVDTGLLEGLKYRNVGPFRGGRAVTATGVVGDDKTYYFGATGGGVWKTTNAGHTWENVSDGFFNVGTIGAIAVSASNTNVVYVGSGESPTRGVATAQGDGIYKSTDGGKTWTHLDLKMRGQVSMIKVHPTNPDIAWFAVQGSPYVPTNERGVYMTTDGGKTFKRTLFVNERTSAIDLKIIPSNPNILFASMWDNQRKPWRIESGGEGSGLYKSTDGGETWTKMTKGLPKLLGKMGIAPSPADPQRVYAIVEAEEKTGGLYRSDDGGDSWKLINADRQLAARSWYYMHITADPVDRDKVYVMNSGLYKMTDAGKTKTPLYGTHGDYHGLWINPDDTNNMVVANDGGGAVTFNGGTEWSTQHNQPTAQFYRISADNHFPYRLSSGQQDNTSVIINSRSPDGVIDGNDYINGPGCESAFVAFDQQSTDPKYYYGGCYLGQIDELNMENGESRNVVAYPEIKFGVPARERKYRFNWNAPIVVSYHDPSVIYHAGNQVMMSNNRGHSWTEISPDLTRDEEDTEKQGQMGGPITNEVTENYNTITYLEESHHEKGVIYVGTDDGLIQVTRDNGKTWKNVTPSGLGHKLVNSIEVSPHDPATAYAAVTGYKNNEYEPLIFKTTNYGKSWKKIVKGIPKDDPVRVVREDTVRKGLLFAGTETSLYISFDDGKNWQDFQLNMPHVPMTDMLIKGNDLAISTQGRAFWILDNITPLREMSDDIQKKAVHMFKPVDGFDFIEASTRGIGEGIRNPDDGAWIYYNLGEAPEKGTKVKMEILDKDGNLVRTVSKGVSAKKGLNRFVWDLQTDGMDAAKGIFSMMSRRGGKIGGMPVSLGSYTARLSVGDNVVEQGFNVIADPRATEKPDAAAQHDLQKHVYNMLKTFIGSYNMMQDVVAQAKDIKSRKDDNAMPAELVSAADALIKAAGDWMESVANPKREFFQDVLNWEDRFYTDLQGLYGAALGDYTAGVVQRHKDLMPVWQDFLKKRDAIVNGELNAFNNAYAKAGLGGILPKKVD